jgi:hypothetical protein
MNFLTFIPRILNEFLLLHVTTCKRKTIPVTGRVGTYCFDTSRFPHFLDNRLTDGGEVARSPSSSQEDTWCSFPLEAESILGP